MGNNTPKYHVQKEQIVNQQDKNLKGLILRDYPPFKLSLPYYDGL